MWDGGWGKQDRPDDRLPAIGLRSSTPHPASLIPSSGSTFAPSRLCYNRRLARKQDMEERHMSKQTIRRTLGTTAFLLAGVAFVGASVRQAARPAAPATAQKIDEDY